LITPAKGVPNIDVESEEKSVAIGIAEAAIKPLQLWSPQGYQLRNVGTAWRRPDQ
jgi:hypothetical protein